MEYKFYIPSSTLNFNGIVSSESISPACFYSQRRFGLRRFVDIFNGKYSQHIILSNSMQGFSRPVSDIEDHPMIIEVRIDESEVTPLADGFYSIDRTIYITPYNCRFLFFKKQDKLVTESLSKHSLEVKLSSLYIPRMVVVQPSGEYDFSKIMIKGAVVSDETSKVDERLNRLKGMLFGYYIGAILSARKEDVEKLRILQEVQNEFSAIISSGVNHLSTEKEVRLRELSMRWEQLSPLYIELTREGHDVIKINSILRKYGARLPINNLGLSHYTKYLTQQTEDGKKNSAMVWIEGEIVKQSNSMMGHGMRIKPEDGNIITNGEDVINIQITDHKELVKHWLNTLLLDSKQTARDSYSKMELATMITLSAKVHIGNGWEGCTERDFLNKLRKHTAGEAFDVEWDNGALCSIAAVVLRGDEWDTMLSFMQSKGMFDYRLAFALYGALTGYANMTRDFVDLLFEDKNYGFQVYKEVYGQLLGRELHPITNSTSSLSYTQVTPPKEATTITTNPQSAAQNPGNGHIPEQFDERVINIVSLIQKHPDYQEKYSKNIKKIEEQGLTDWDEIEKLDKWKTFIGKIKPDKQKAKRTSQKQKETVYTQGTLFAEKEENLFYNDGEAWDKIKELVPIESQQKLKGDLEWYQGELKKGGNSKYYSKVRRDSNKDAIAVFVRLKDGKADYFPEELRNAIKQRLMSLYCNDDGENKSYS